MKIEKIDISALMELMNSKILQDCMIEITNTCSFRCDHCYIENSKKQLMKFDTFKSIIDELISINCNTILITGGEPTLNPDFIKMYVYAKKNGMFVSINTNGFKFNDSIKETFLKYKPDAVEISLYGYNDLSYTNFTHTNNAYTSVIENIEFLKNNNINLKLKTTVTTKNYKYVHKLKEIAKKYNTEFRYDYLVFPKVDGKIFAENKYRLTPNDIIEIIKQDNEDVDYFKKQVNTTMKMKNKNNNIEKVFTCSLGKSKIFIDCFENIRPCLVVPKKYNIKKYSIKEALSDMDKFTHSINFKNSNKCQNCYKRKLCRYCPGRFYLETGQYDVPPTFYCKLADLMLKEFK